MTSMPHASSASPPPAAGVAAGAAGTTAGAIAGAAAGAAAGTEPPAAARAARQYISAEKVRVRRLKVGSETFQLAHLPRDPATGRQHRLCYISRTNQTWFCLAAALAAEDLARSAGISRSVANLEEEGWGEWGQGGPPPPPPQPLPPPPLVPLQGQALQGVPAAAAGGGGAAAVAVLPLHEGMQQQELAIIDQAILAGFQQQVGHQQEQQQAGQQPGHQQEEEEKKEDQQQQGGERRKQLQQGEEQKQQQEDEEEQQQEDTMLTHPAQPQKQPPPPPVRLYLTVPRSPTTGAVEMFDKLKDLYNFRYGCGSETVGVMKDQGHTATNKVGSVQDYCRMISLTWLLITNRNHSPLSITQLSI